MTQPDPIRDYLDRLRASLRVAPREAELILAEAEDHLRRDKRGITSRRQLADRLGHR